MRDLTRHLARFLHIFQQGKEILDKILLCICSLSVSEVSHISQPVWLETALSALTQTDEHSPWFTRRAGNAHPLCREYLLLTPSSSHPATHKQSLCAHITLGIGLFLFKVQLFLWKPDSSVSFSSFQKCRGYVFWQTCASDPTLSISPENFLLFSHLLSQCLSFYDSSL